MKTIFRVGVYAVAGLGFVAGAAQSLSAATELARINGSVITLEDFEKRYNENKKFFQFKAPTRKAVLDDLIKREIGIQEARRQKLDKDPEVIERMNTVLYHALLEKNLNKEFEGIQIKDDEAKAYYSKYPELRTSHIFVSVAPNATPQQVREAEERIKKIRDTQLKEGKMSFAEIAQRFSEGSAAPMGGDIDYMSRDRLDPAYYDAALKLKVPGKVSDIVRSQFGFHIIKLTAIRSWEDADKAQVKRMLYEERRNQIFERYIGQLRQQSKVSVRSELLKE